MAKKDVGPASTPALMARGDEGIGGLDAHTEQDVVRQMPSADGECGPNLTQVKYECGWNPRFEFNR